jgi:hypothetical protein
MPESLEYESVASSDSENEQIQAPKITKRKAKPNLVLDTELDDEPVPVPKGKGRPRKSPVKEINPDEPPKPKRVQSAAQKANFQKCLETRKQNIAMRNQQKADLAAAEELKKEEKQKALQKKIIKKSISIKKKEILSQASLDEVSDCDIPDEIVEKIIKKQRAKAKAKAVTPGVSVEPPKPKYNFV